MRAYPSTLILMVVTVASFKGGVGKSTTAIHLAAYLQALAPALLVDGDPNRSVTEWARAGKLPFKVVDERQAALHAKEFEHIVIDTKARPDEEDLRALALGCHLLVIPCTPDPLSLRALGLTVTALKSIGADRYRVLLTVVPPRPSRDGDDAREMIEQMGLPLFAASIPRLVAFQRAVLEGTTVAGLKDPRGLQSWDEYRRVGDEVVSLATRKPAYATTQTLG
jgi:chromosome partitioning protein